MKRYLAVVVFVAVGSRCVALQRTPDATVLQSVGTIAVIPMESAGPGAGFPPPRPPLVSGPGAEVLKTALDPRSPVFLPVATVFAIYLMADEAAKAAARPSSPLTVERELRAGREMLSVDLAKAAAEAIQRDGGRTVYLVDGYVRLPGVAEKASPTEAELEMNRQMVHLWREDVSSVDYSGLGLAGLDAILEVGLYLYNQDERGRLGMFGVQVRLVDPNTRQVLGRAHDWLPMFSQARKLEPSEQRDKAVGRDLLARCLKDLGLLAE